MSAKKGSDGNAGGGQKKPPRQGRSSDLGRALRTVYDDTLRESVPDDFMDLLGKLS
ncbi:MAG: NepR family anti-sigma factor [Pseudomonadota bacterium]|nr:NepR family anti-sigma factor [Pseudomonadota bacterium]